MKCAKKHVARIYPQSGLSMKGLSLGGGIIDSDYRSNISIILTNLSQRIFEIKTGDRIAQLMFLKKEDIDFVEADEFDDKMYCDTKGFVSTGLKPTESRRKKMPAGIKSVHESVDFSGMTASDKEEFCKRIKADQLNLAN